MIEIQSLREALDNLDLKQLLDIFKTFKCEKDDEIENFLLSFSIDYENNNVCRTYFVMDEKYPSVLLGYFSIGLNVMHFEESIDVKDAYDGINLYEQGYRPIYKLFMLGKNDQAKDLVKMSDVFFDKVLPICREAQSCVAGSLLYIDCIPELQSYYEGLNFQFYDEVGEHGLIRMIRSL